MVEGALTQLGTVDLGAAQAFAGKSLAPNTLRAYKSQCSLFGRWAVANGAAPMPASPYLVAAYLAHLAQAHGDQPPKAYASIVMARSAIRWGHRVKRMPDPTSDPAVSETMDGIARELGTAPLRQAIPLSADECRKVLASIEGDGLAAMRDRALIAVWYVGAMRASEMAAMRVADLTWRPDGALYQLRRSKTDQTGRGRTVAIAAGPATHHLRAWVDRLALYGCTGPVFIALDGLGLGMGAIAVSEVVARRCEAAGVVGRRTGHSLRSGHVTEAAQRGVPALQIAGQTGHKSLDMVLRYTRPVDALRDSSGRGLL